MKITTKQAKTSRRIAVLAAADLAAATGGTNGTIISEDLEARPHGISGGAKQ